VPLRWPQPKEVAPGLILVQALGLPKPRLPATSEGRLALEAALQVKTRLAAVGVFQVLRSDADYLAEAMTRDQAMDLGFADSQPEVAIWAQTPEGQKQLEKERRETLERLRRGV
jgi:hypothetical protein